MMSTELHLDGVCKSYGPLKANDRVSLVVKPGSVHALLGENGAGKSTLVGLITGQQRVDAGAINYGGATINSPSGYQVHPRISTVRQDLSLVPVMTAMENIALGLRTENSRTLRAKVKAVMNRTDVRVELDTPIEELQIPDRQRIELIRALCTDPEVLILDEPTTYIPPTETERFLGLLRELARGGLAVLLITHRLDEAELVADEATVMRRGRIVASHQAGGLPSKQELAVQIVGGSLPIAGRQRPSSREVLLEVTDLSLRHQGHPVLHEISLEIRSGEIFGIAGVDGNGQHELLEVLAGLRAPDEGLIRLGGTDVTHRGVRGRRGTGIAFVSGDRLNDEIFPSLTVAAHYQLAAPALEATSVRQILGRFDVRPADPHSRADSLSGGNAQKMVMGRALAGGSRLLLLEYPTQGLDVAAAGRMHQRMFDAAEGGVTFVVISSDLEELLMICDRIAVLSAGRIAGVQESMAYDREVLAAWYTKRRTVE